MCKIRSIWECRDFYWIMNKKKQTSLLRHDRIHFILPPEHRLYSHFFMRQAWDATGCLTNYFGHTISVHVRHEQKSATTWNPTNWAWHHTLSQRTNKTKQVYVTLVGEQIYLKFTSLFRVACVLVTQQDKASILIVWCQVRDGMVCFTLWASQLRSGCL